MTTPENTHNTYEGLIKCIAPEVYKYLSLVNSWNLLGPVWYSDSLLGDLYFASSCSLTAVSVPLSREGEANVNVIEAGQYAEGALNSLSVAAVGRRVRQEFK